MVGLHVTLFDLQNGKRTAGAGIMMHTICISGAALLRYKYHRSKTISRRKIPVNIITDSVCKNPQNNTLLISTAKAGSFSVIHESPRRISLASASSGSGSVILLDSVLAEQTEREKLACARFVRCRKIRGKITRRASWDSMIYR